MASNVRKNADRPAVSNDNRYGDVEACSGTAIMLRPVTQETGHWARKLTEEEQRVRRVTTALRKRLTAIAAERAAGLAPDQIREL